MEAARTLMREQGLEQTSVTQIAKAAGVTHSLINAYFGSKAGLLYEILHDFNQEQIDRINREVELTGSTRDRIEALVRLWLDHELKDRQMLSVMQAYSWQWSAETEKTNQEHIQIAVRPLYASFELGIERGEIRADLDVAETIEIILAIFAHGVRKALHLDHTTEAALALIMRRIDILFDGLRQSSIG